jgi:hypothetical protein
VGTWITRYIRGIHAAFDNLPSPAARLLLLHLPLAAQHHVNVNDNDMSMPLTILCSSNPSVFASSSVVLPIWKLAQIIFPTTSNGTCLCPYCGVFVAAPAAGMQH